MIDLSFMRSKLLRTAFVLFFYLLCASNLFATGWLDYKLDIGDGYSILRANSFDVMLLKNGESIISNHEYDSIGPITHYFKDSNHIFLKTAGWRFRNLFKGDQFKKIDSSKEYFFVVEITDGEISGPLTRAEFLDNDVVVRAGNIDWARPRNPSFWHPVLGFLLFVLLSIPLMYVKYWYTTMPATALVTLWVFTRWRRRSRFRTAETPEAKS